MSCTCSRLLERLRKSLAVEQECELHLPSKWNRQNIQRLKAEIADMEKRLQVCGCSECRAEIEAEVESRR